MKRYDIGDSYLVWLLERVLARRGVHPCRRTITPPYAGKHSAQPSQVSPVRCTERLCRHANHWKCPVVMVSIPLARRHGMCGRVASTRSRSGSEAPEPGPPRLCAGRNRRRRRSATPRTARGERYVSVDRQSKGGVNFSRITRRRQAAEVSEGLGRSPGPCHTSSASFLSTSSVPLNEIASPARLPSNS